MASSALKSVICGHLVVAKLDLVEVDSNSSVADAVKEMERHHIQSVPVYDTTKKGYIGTVSMFDVVMFAVKKNATETDAASLLANTTVRSLIGLYKEWKTLIHCREQAHKGIATQGKRTGGLHGVQATSQLANVMKPFSDGIPRILVALGFVKSDPSKPLFRLLSATDVVSYLTGRLESFPEVAQTPIAQCMVSEIVTRPLSANTREALVHMFEQSGDAIAVVDDSGVLATTLSVSDCRDMSAISDMDKTIEDFLKERNFDSLREPVSVRSSDVLSDAMRKVVAAHIHRAWVVDDNNKPVGVVRLQDMLRHFI